MIATIVRVSIVRFPFKVIRHRLTSGEIRMATSNPSGLLVQVFHCYKSPGRSFPVAYRDRKPARASYRCHPFSRSYFGIRVAIHGCDGRYAANKGD